MTLPVHPSVSSGRASLISVPRPSHRLSRGSRLALTIVIALCTAVLADRPAAQQATGRQFQLVPDGKAYRLEMKTVARPTPARAATASTVVGP